MPQDAELPLHLYQVLEEEYLSLVGELSPRETVRLGEGAKDIVAELDWDFHRGHIKDQARLVTKLTPRGEAYGDDLASYLRKAAPDFSGAFAAARSASDYEAALNELLRVPVYDPEAFKDVALSDALRVLLERPPGADSPQLAHVNRLLLEETFPDELEKASDIRLAAMYARIHRHEHGQAAICLSGGGIRSGTFALGLLQGLARHDLLQRFDYLSTVSGGGYIGGWLTAWLHRHRGGLAGVTEDVGAAAPKSKVEPDPPAIRYLREYSNFLTPQAGLLTADTWAFVAIYLRNLLLNWLVLIPLLLALLALPRLNVALLLSKTGAGEWLGVPVRYAFLGLGSALLTLTFTYIIVSRPAVGPRVVKYSPFWRGRLGQRHFLRWCLLPLVSAAFCLTTYWAWSSAARDWVPQDKLTLFVVFGLAVTLAAWVVGSFSLGRFTRPLGVGWLELVEFVILAAVGAGGGALLYYASTSRTSWEGEWYAWYACLAVPSMLLVILLVTTLYVGVTSKGLFGWSELLNDEDREWWARFSAWVIIAMLAWAAFNVISIHGPRLYYEANYLPLLTSVGGLSGLASLLAGFSSKTPANDERAKSEGGMLKAFVRDQLLPLAALLFLLVFLVVLSILVTALLFALAAALGGFLGGLGLSPTRDAVDLSRQPYYLDAHLLVTYYARFWFVLFFAGALAAVSLALANRINLNKFSLHASYRNRLIRGFLGASRDRGLRRPNPFTGFDPEDNVQMHELRPALFHEGDFENLESLAVKIVEGGAPAALSGLIKSRLSRETLSELEGYAGTTQLPQRLRINLVEDLNAQVLESELIVPDGAGLLKEVEEPVPQDDRTIIEKRSILQRNYPEEIRKKYPPPHRLFHVVNTSLNLVGGKNLAWQQRKAEPFVLTPLHAGSFRVGYRRSRHYGGYRGVSLGTAVAVSGAAASSNMGYYTTSPVLSMVLTLFNVRLGWWLGNPGPAGQETYRREAPRVSLRPVVEEALGLTDDTNPYVYLTDGGHFENLALYEMVLRRCRLVVLSDAAADGKFEFGDLGNAVRKIRIDLGVPIDFDEVRIFKERPDQKDPRAGAYSYWAFGRIRYSRVDKVTSAGANGETVVGAAPDGVLIYIKPTVYKDAEPRDVLQYKEAHADFPHQSTGDQFFDEPQFESYRMLGWHIMSLICENLPAGGGRGGEGPTRAQFVRAALDNYGGAKPGWLDALLKDADWLG